MSSPFPKQPVRAEFGKDAVDSRVLRHAADIVDKRVQVKGIWGRCVQLTVIKVLIKMANAIQEGKI